MNREAHSEDLSTPWFNTNCACHQCSVKRRVDRVTNALQGKQSSSADTNGNIYTRNPSSNISITGISNP